MADLDFSMDDDLYDYYRHGAEAAGVTVEEHIKLVLAVVAERWLAARVAASPDESRS